ncbi:hypothetical protein U27_05418 [Candidatus Vecturithrix granuli]|uniref:Cys-tRNA(Pro)/Cys-tRNA(Cys) deacylase n=1 Tax=Vecturithrix granuli TaxID=1499967 RepID=A0A081C1I9_VECG1|nr:hypothetical protein U27_05418 [Candidatus Vecturithrix granuli]
MVKAHYPKTPAIHFLNAKKIPFETYFYSYEDHGGTERAANELDLPEHAVLKTLIMETDEHHPFVVLMHGDREVSLKQLARELDVKRVSPCSMELAQKVTGYLVGGISPFGVRTPLPVYIESSIFTLDKIYINGGKRGFLVGIAPQDLRKAFSVKEVTVAIQP